MGLKLSYYIFILFLLVRAQFAFTQVSTSLTRAVTYQSIGNATAQDVCNDHAGHIYMLGNQAAVQSVTGSDAFLYKINETTLQVIWYISIANSSTDVLNGIAYSAVDDALVVVGYQILNGVFVPIIKKYSSSGSLVWSYQHPVANQFLFLQKVAISPQGLIYACGKASGQGILNESAVVIRLTSLGTQASIQFINESYNTQFSNIKYYNDTIYVVGSSENILGNIDFYVVKLTNQLDTIQSKTWGSPTKQEYLLSCVNNANRLLVAGYADTNFKQSAFAFNLNRQFQQQWSYLISGTINDFGVDVLSFGGDWLLIVNTKSYASGNINSNDFLFHYINANGFFIKGPSGITSKNEELTSCTKLNDSTFVAVGTTNAKLKKPISSALLVKQVVTENTALAIDSLGVLQPLALKSNFDLSPLEIYNLENDVIVKSKYVINACEVFDLAGKKIDIYNFYNQFQIELSKENLPKGILFFTIALSNGEKKQFKILN